MNNEDKEIIEAEFNVTSIGDDILYFLNDMDNQDLLVQAKAFLINFIKDN